MATAELEEIVIEDVGPVEQLRIPLPVGGGLVLLTGDNGSGKSETLSCARALMGSADDKKSLRPRDGEKSGSVEGCGVTIKVGRSNRETGELTVAALEDRLDIADLVDPGIADPNAADARRLKSLIRVAGVKADLDLFSDLLGDTFEIDAKVMKEPDLINMAGGVKRSLEAKARSEENKAEACGVEAATCLKSVEGVDITGESDEAALQAAYREAANRDAEVKQRQLSAEQAQEAQCKAREALATANRQYDGPTLEWANDLHDAAAATHQERMRAVRDLEESLMAARRFAEQSREALVQAEATLNAAANHARTIEAWEQQITADQPAAPTDAEISAAHQALARATTAMQNGAIVRNAKAKIEQANEWTKKRKASLKAAEQFRESAKGVDEVLSQVVAGLGCPIKVGEDDKGLRLTIQHPKRGLTFFSELSMGEKVRIVLPIAVNAVGPGGLFVAPQEFWEGLQPSAKRDVARLLKNTGVWMLTAQCADGPLVAQEVSA